MKNIKLVQEFKTFSMRGSVVDLAVGIIIGSAFGKIVSSLVADILMPPIGFMLGGYDFRNIIVKLPAILGKQAVEIRLGLFLNNVVDFLIVAFAVFLLVKLMNKMRLHEEIKTVKNEPSKEVVLLTEIRDLLKKG